MHPIKRQQVALLARLIRLQSPLPGDRRARPVLRPDHDGASGEPLRVLEYFDGHAWQPAGLTCDRQAVQAWVGDAGEADLL